MATANRDRARFRRHQISSQLCADCASPLTEIRPGVYPAHWWVTKLTAGLLALGSLLASCLPGFPVAFYRTQTNRLQLRAQPRNRFKCESHRVPFYPDMKQVHTRSRCPDHMEITLRMQRIFRIQIFRASGFRSAQPCPVRPPGTC